MRDRIHFYPTPKTRIEMILKEKKRTEAIEAYKIAISNVQYEGSLVWSRFGVLAGANTIVAGALGLITSNADIAILNFNVVLLISLIGFFVGLMWFHVTKRGFATINFWTLTAREIEDKLPIDILNLYRRGADFKDNREVKFRIDNKDKSLIRPWIVRNGFRTENAAILIILVFIIVYIGLFFYSLRQIDSAYRNKPDSVTKVTRQHKRQFEHITSKHFKRFQ